MAQTFAPTATYGSNAVKNRIKFGGSLGTNQYFYVTNAKTGTVEINRYEKEYQSGRVTETKIGKIPQGGKFIPNSNAARAEKTHYSSSREIGKVRSQALQIANREWDGRTQPPPSQAIYGTNSGNIGYTPPASSTADTSVRGVQESGYSTDLNTTSNPRKSSLQNNLRDIASFGRSLGFSSPRRRGRGGSNNVIVYPSTLRRSGGNAQDYIKIDRMEYAPSKREGYTWKSGSDSKNRIKDGTVVLPIPGGISDSNATTWGGDTMSPVETAMANLALSGIEDGFSAMADTAGQIGQNLKENDKQTKDAISKGIAGMASGTGAQLLTRTTGQVMNPNMELLFKEPTLRPFNFTWKLAARSRDEADSIIRIINFFKRGMAPQTAGEGLFLKSPNTWKLTYMHRGSEHRYLNKFKECALQSFTTQYTPDGNYATFETGHMVAYSITLGLTELKPILSTDYRGDNEIGY